MTVTKDEYISMPRQVFRLAEEFGRVEIVDPKTGETVMVIDMKPLDLEGERI